MSKTPEMEKALNDLTEKVFGRKRNSGVCVTCGSTKVKRENFKDNISWKEWHISYMCQECQDGVFTEPSVFGEEE
jgi:hypothetical protein